MHRACQSPERPAADAENRRKTAGFPVAFAAKKIFQAGWWAFFRITRTVMPKGPIRPKTGFSAGKTGKSPRW